MDIIVIGYIWMVSGIIFGIIVSCAKSDPLPIIAVVLTGLGVFGVTKRLSNYNDNNFEYPTAMDVYQGKTTLKITYEDSVAVDSVVVFKTTKK